MIKNKAKTNIQKSPALMKRLIEKLKEEAFFLNKKLELIKMNPNELDTIFKMDKVSLMNKNITDEIKGTPDEPCDDLA